MFPALTRPLVALSGGPPPMPVRVRNLNTYNYQASHGAFLFWPFP